MNKKGVLTVVSGFSGAGKGTLMKAIVEKYAYALSISATTRSPRAGEEHGREYYFLTKQEFESMIEKDQLIEWAKYVDNYYGTPKEYVEKQLAEGKNVILEIEIQGALDVKKRFPDALLLFVTPPSAVELKQRLVHRGTEDMETINKRMKRAAEESQYMNQYDYILINDKMEDCVEQMNAIINQAADCLQKGEKFKAEEDFTPLIDKLQSELKAL